MNKSFLFGSWKVVITGNGEEIQLTHIMLNTTFTFKKNDCLGNVYLSDDDYPNLSGVLDMRHQIALLGIMENIQY